VRWKILTLLIILAYPFVQTSDVHGEIVSHEVTVYFDNNPITFEISANKETDEGQSLNVTLSVTGAWNDFYGFLYYNGNLFTNETMQLGVIEPELTDGYEWSGIFSISGLGLGSYILMFECWYWPEGGDDYQDPVTPSITVYVVQAKSIFTFTWLTPLSKKNSFEAGRTIPVRFSVHDDKGDFKPDTLVTVTVANATWQEVFSYGTHRHDVRIRESAEYYIVYWKTTGLTPGQYTISVEFEKFNVEPYSFLSIELR